MGRTDDQALKIGDSEGLHGSGVWEHFTVGNGLPELKIECLAEDRLGAIWIGTHDCGVARYREGEITCFDRRHGLPGDGVYSVTEDLDGNLWFGTNRGPCVLRGESFERPPGATSDGLLWGSFCDQRGRMWFGLDRRPGEPPAVCCSDGNRFHVYPVARTGTEFGESIHAVFGADDESLLLGGDSLYRFSLEDAEAAALEGHLPGPFRVRDIRAGAKGLLVADHWGVWRAGSREASLLVRMQDPGASALAVDERGGFWIASGNGELAHMGDSEPRLVRNFRRPVQCVLVDTRGQLWVGTYGAGLYRLDESTWQIFGQNAEFVPTCIENLTDGRVLIGSTTGVWWSLNGVSVERADYPVGDGAITAIRAIQTEVWFGGRGGWLARYGNGRLEEVALPEGAKSFRISKICYDPKSDSVWYSSSPGRGIGVVDRAGNVTHFGPNNESRLPQWVGDIRLTESACEVVLATCEGKGNDRVVRLVGTHIVSTDVWCDRPINAMEELGGKVYVGTSGGLFLIEDSSLRKVGFPNGPLCDVVTCLHVDAAETLWIGTAGGGIGHFDGSLLLSMDIPGGAAHNIVSEITTDDAGNVWIVTEGGLVKFCPKESVAKVSTTVRVNGIALAEPATVQRGSTATIELSLTGISSSEGWFYRYRLSDRSPWEVASGDSVELDTLELGEVVFECHAIDIKFRCSATEVRRLVVEESDHDLRLREALSTGGASDGLVGGSQEIDSVRTRIRKIADSDLGILLLGETGTGKSIAAKLIHTMSARRNGPFVQINCGAITESLAEAEFFGHEKGAFTGATQRRAGKFQLANGGTVFLDEVGDLSLSVQPKILHVLQDRRVEPVGSSRSRDIDVRVIAATNRDLKEAVRDGRFREDLLYRLNPFTLTLPPLRERKGDVIALARHFASDFARHLSRPCPELTERACELLESYHWPGNVRELEHMIQRAVILSSGLKRIDASHLPFGGEVPTEERPSRGRYLTMASAERRHILEVLVGVGWIIEGPGGAAQVLDVNPSTLRSRMKRLGIVRP